MTQDSGLAVAFCLALLLGGCADDANIGEAAQWPTGTETPASAGAGDQLYLAVVDGLIKQGRQGAALAFLDSYRQSGQPPSPRYWLLRGNALFALGRNDQASVAYSKLQGTPLAADGWNGMGRIAAVGHNWNAADDNFRKAVAGDPANADFLNNLAFADLHLDKAADSAVWLLQAHELDPGSDRIRNNLIIALTLKGDGGRADTIIAAIKDGKNRDAVRLLVKNAVEALKTDGKS